MMNSFSYGVLEHFNSMMAFLLKMLNSYFCNMFWNSFFYQIIFCNGF